MNRIDILKELMENKKMKVADVVKKTTLPYSTVKSIMENGAEKASYINISLICQALDITTDDLERAVKNSKVRLTDPNDEETNKSLKPFPNLYSVKNSDEIIPLDRITNPNNRKTLTESNLQKISGTNEHGEYVSEFSKEDTLEIIRDLADLPSEAMGDLKVMFEFMSTKYNKGK